MLRGQPAQRLSVHYRLGCDYGTALIKIYREGDPVFLCAAHATTIGRTDDNCIAGVRLIESQPAIEARSAEGNGGAASTAHEGVKLQDSPVEKQGSNVPSKAGGSLTGARTQRETAPTARRTPRELAYGDSAKALVDETIWNMPAGDYQAYTTALQQGKPPAEAAQAAGGQIAIIHRKIGEYTLKIEGVLSESKATINVRDAIDKPFENAVLEIIGNIAMGDVEKDEAIEHLGEFQQQINRGLSSEITPLQAYRIVRAVGDRASWGASFDEDLKPGFRGVYQSVRNALRAAVPEACDLEKRLANLCAARSDLEIAADPISKRNCGTSPTPRQAHEPDSSETRALSSR